MFWLYGFSLLLIGVLGTNGGQFGGIKCYSSDGEKTVKQCDVFGFDHCYAVQCSGGIAYGCHGSVLDLLKEPGKECAETALISGYCAEQEKGAYKGGACKICEDDLCNEPVEVPNDKPKDKPAQPPKKAGKRGRPPKPVDQNSIDSPKTDTNPGHNEDHSPIEKPEEAPNEMTDMPPKENAEGPPKTIEKPEEEESPEEPSKSNEKLGEAPNEKPEEPSKTNVKQDEVPNEKPEEPSKTIEKPEEEEKPEEPSKTNVKQDQVPNEKPEEPSKPNKKPAEEKPKTGEKPPADNENGKGEGNGAAAAGNQLLLTVLLVAFSCCWAIYCSNNAHM